MVKVLKYSPKMGVTTEEEPEGEHEAVIKDTVTVKLQRAKRDWDKKRWNSKKSRLRTPRQVELKPIPD